jgi:two-component system OmpR family sensor kinase
MLLQTGPTPATDDVLFVVSHELRTPITVVQGYLDLLLAAPELADPDARAHLYARLAQQQVRRMALLVEDLIDVARVQSGKLRLQQAPLDLAALARQVVEMARMLARGQSIALVSETAPLWVRGDAGRLEQVLLNLLGNAFAHTPAGTRVEVGLWQVGAEVALVVQDDGPGIPAEALPHIFARFAQAEQAEPATHGGLGLGLHICQELVAAHGGRLEARSAEGVGVAFTVRLPLIGAEEGASDTQGSGQMAPDRHRGVLPASVVTI